MCFGQFPVSLYVCAFSRLKDKMAVWTCFSFKCITEYSVELLYQKNDVTVNYVPLLVDFLSDVYKRFGKLFSVKSFRRFYLNSTHDAESTNKISKIMSPSDRSGDILFLPR